jgi:hypothetical protein
MATLAALIAMHAGHAPAITLAMRNRLRTAKKNTRNSGMGVSRLERIQDSDGNRKE